MRFSDHNQPGGPLLAGGIATSSSSTEWVVGQSLAMRRVAQHAFRASEAECTVLISGETGTGKEIWRVRCIAAEPGPKSRSCRSIAPP